MSKKLTKSVFLFFLFFFMFVPGSAADFSNKIEIDCIRESEYSLIVETNNYKIYYANSEGFNYIYVSASFQIYSAKLISGTFEIDISGSNTESGFHESMLNKSGIDLTEIEIKAHRQTLGYEITLKLNEFTIKLSLEPQKNPDDRPVIDPAMALEAVLNWIWLNPWIIALFILFINLIIVAAYCALTKPWMHAQKKGKIFEMESIGRIIGEEQVVIPLPLWKLRTRKGEFYSTRNFNDLKGYKDWSIGKMVHYFSHLKQIPHKLNEDEYFERKVEKDTKWAHFCHFWYDFLKTIFFWSGRMEVWASKLIRYDDEKTELVKEITLLQLEYLMKRREIRLTVKYEVLSTEKEGEYETKKEKNIPLHRYFHLLNTLSTKEVEKTEKPKKKTDKKKKKKAKEDIEVEKDVDKQEIPNIKKDSIKIVGKLKQKVVKMNSLGEAINQQQTIDDLISINELDQLHMQKKYQKLMNLYIKKMEENRKLKTDMQNKAYKYAERMRNQYLADLGPLMEIIGRVAHKTDIGYEEEDAIKEALKEIVNTMEKEKSENSNGTNDVDINSLKKEIESLKKDKENLLEIVKNTKNKSLYEIED